MSIALREIMGVFPFSEAKLVAGHGGLERQVISANIQEVPDVERWLVGGEIVFSSGYALRELENPADIISALHDKEAAALAIKPGRYLEAIPREMIERADALRFPLFELPQNLPYMDCIMPIFERLTQKRLYLLDRMESIHNMLTKAMVENRGLEEICATLNRAVSRRIAVLTPQALLLANAAGESSEAWETQIGECRTRILRSNMEKMLKNECNILQLDSGSMICIPIHVQDETIAYLFAEALQEDAAQSMDNLILSNASTLIAIGILNERAVLLQQQRALSQLLEDILFKRYQDENAIVRRGKYVGFDLNDRTVVFVVGSEGAETRMRSELHYSERRIQAAKEDIQRTLLERMKIYPRGTIMVERAFGQIGMIVIEEEDDVARCAKILRETIDYLENKYPPLHFSAGIGRVKQSVRAIAESFAEAQQAMKISAQMRSRGEEDRHVLSFENLGCISFLSELSGSESMLRFRDECLGALLEHDREFQANLLETLSVYFASGGNIRKTAEMMFLHKNTVIYRLGKIEAITGKSLKNEKDAFELQLSLKLLDVV